MGRNCSCSHYDASCELVVDLRNASSEKHVHEIESSIVTSTKRSWPANGLTGLGFPWLLPGGVGILQPGTPMLVASTMRNKHNYRLTDDNQPVTNVTSRQEEYHRLFVSSFTVSQIELSQKRGSTLK